LASWIKFQVANVRQRTSETGSEEVILQSYESASEPSELHASILAALKAGVSTRQAANVVGKTHGTGRSNVSLECGRRWGISLLSTNAMRIRFATRVANWGM